MSDQELDRAMRRALLDAAARDWAALEEQPFCACAPSRRHRREMRAMLRDPLRWARRRGQPRQKRAFARAAACVLAVLLGLCALTLCIPSARAAVRRWFIEWADSAHFIYHYTGQAPAEALPRYEITALPEGFSEVERVESDAFTSVVFENQTDQADGALYFEYHYIFETGLAAVNTEDSDIYDVKVKHMPGKYIKSRLTEGFSELTWIDEDAGIQFYLSSQSTQIDIVNIAENVSLVKATK